ncbi:MAG: VOC family protein [Rhodothermales bacterium]|nr:VOC family protein [Rhodothermales bacterium]
MNETLTHAPGTFCWVELLTTDAEAAKAFYGDLFGWSNTDTPAGPDTTYTTFQHDGRDVGGLYEMNAEQRAEGTPPHWLLYACVDDAGAAAERVRQHGGAVLAEPFDVMEAGRIAIVQEPAGATFALWEPREHPGAGVVGEPASLCWSELASRDAEASGAFLSRLFGWDTTSRPIANGTGTYTYFAQDEREVGGMLQMTDEWGDLPSHWSPYFAVTDCEATARRAEAAGGTVEVPPMDIPGAGRAAGLRDPQGAFFYVIQLSDG